MTQEHRATYGKMLYSLLASCSTVDLNSSIQDQILFWVLYRPSHSYLLGHSQQAISLSGSSSSYFQVSSLTGLGTPNGSYSISLWIQPRSLSGIVVDVSSDPTAMSWCLPFVGFAASGGVIGQTLSSTSVRSVLGPSVSTSSAWSHIFVTWSTTNKLQLYVNNVLVGSNNLATIYTGSGLSNYVTLGNGFAGAGSCFQGILGSSNPYNGDIDDFRVYSRELTSSEVLYFTICNYGKK